MAILNQILQKAIEKKVNDINITENRDIYFRIGKDLVRSKIFIDNVLIEEIVTELAGDSAYITIYKGEPIDRSYQFEKINAETGEVEKFYFRYNIVKVDKGIHITIRNLVNKIPKFETIQFTGEEANSFLKSIEDSIIGESKMNGGIYIISGATGSGKTTTILTLIDYILKKYDKKVITIEAPIEYRFTEDYGNSLIEQREVPRDVATFDQGVIDAMRQNPDVIFIGEIRDKETAYTAYTAALTGHTVFATLHANSTQKVIDRLKSLLEDTKEVDFSFIKGVVHQRLVKDKDSDKIIAKRDFLLV